MKMKIALIFIFALMVAMCSTIVVSAQEKAKNEKEPKGQKDFKAAKIKLFNGKTLKNWVFILKEPTIDTASVFSVKDGVIHISGTPFGYMRTKAIYSDYRLHVEWRWPSEATNSGVFVHGQAPDTIWLRCIECQLAAGNAGDFICANGSDMNERTDKTKGVVRKSNPSNEKPVGEWNTMEVTCLGNSIEVFVNGLSQNKGTGLTVNQGHICLQSEGKDIEFRNLYISKARKQKEKQKA